MNLDKKILSLKGEEIPKSFPTKKDIDNLPKDEQGNPDMTKLEKETVGNIILNSLMNYVVQDKREGFYINTIAQSVISGGKVEFKDKLKNFLVEVLEDAIMRKDIEEVEKDGKKVKQEKVKGLYVAWAIAQVLNELGIKE